MSVKMCRRFRINYLALNSLLCHGFEFSFLVSEAAQSMIHGIACNLYIHQVEDSTHCCHREKAPNPEKSTEGN